MSKRQEIRDKRRRQEHNKKYLLIGIITVFALAIVGILVLPNMLKPVGEIKDPIPVSHPQAVNNTMGNPNATVKVEEYADFQCPSCGQFAKSRLAPFIQKYIATNKVYYVFHTFSFIGEESYAAAEAAYCAMDQGKFWEYQEYLFANQNGENIGDFTNKRLIAFADKLGLDNSAFSSCVNSGKHKQKVIEDRALGEKIGINATPSFVVNGKLITNGQLDQEVDNALAKGG
jgi:protein-disulfide isomerase